VLISLLCVTVMLDAQSSPGTVDLVGQVTLPKIEGSTHKPAVVVWLKSADEKNSIEATQPGHFTLIQKNRMFLPHLLVVPLGSVVSFPNADPFFHNVFSLFNGKRFDLGLYEAGSSKEVVFSREGVSYIFCNIHPEMSAVVLSLSTSMYSVADSSEKFVVRQVVPGDYDLHVWIEGTPQPALDRLIRRVHIRAGGPNNAMVDASNSPLSNGEHLNKYGKPYERETTHAY